MNARARILKSAQKDEKEKKVRIEEQSRGKKSRTWYCMCVEFLIRTSSFFSLRQFDSSQSIASSEFIVELVGFVPEYTGSTTIQVR